MAMWVPMAWMNCCVLQGPAHFFVFQSTVPILTRLAFGCAFTRLAGRIEDLELRPVRFYLDGTTGPHADDHGVIALFRKSMI